MADASDIASCALIVAVDWGKYVSVNNILFKYKIHQDTAGTSFIQYNTFERDTEISLRLV